ncbi:MAG: type II secretion system major pseudopilin GspG [Neptuniibacter sp.]
MPFKKRNESGFTLLEIMVVVVILGLLVAIVAPNVLQNQDIAMAEKAKADIASLENALDMYKLDNHSYPTTDQNLNALVNRPSFPPEPKNYRDDGYIKRLPKDPWGNEYQYLSPGEHGRYDLYSFGSDGALGGEGQAKDITSW